MTALRRLAIVALLGLGICNPAGAATYHGYDSVHVLGDSLSDAGNVFRSTLGAVPESPPYWKGRFSSGPVWADRVLNAFRRAGAQTGNHAWGGAKARTDFDGIPDLALQSLQYRRLDSDRRGDRPLLALFAGGNDILRGVGRPDIGTVGRRAADAVGDTAESLARSGVRDFLFFYLPDLGRIPRNVRRGPEAVADATAGTLAFNHQLARRIGELRDDGLNVRRVNTYRFFNNLLADPERYGVSDTSTPCLGPDGSVCSPEEARERVFFDSIHPNAVVHKRLAGIALSYIGLGPEPAVIPAAAVAARAGVAPVPLPTPALLLLAGLDGLGLVARRRAAA
ncbi:MAG: SGNH/GDSL hydrolase family protein [Rhodobacteraceae bacterium]|nr:SGNH/GDSL hydrolase family protein [Paracoccaceae bacterium]